ncbi:MAG: hypothetical protein AAF225_03715 [Pseudomonadota bacterium]
MFRDALVTALVVGPVLIAINYGDLMLDGRDLPVGKMALTMIVPFLVASFSGMRAALRQQRSGTNAGQTSSVATPRRKMP